MHASAAAGPEAPLASPPVLEVPLYQVDAFSSTPFSGNPAAVCLLPAGCALDDATRQAIAAENNLAETAFVEPHPDHPPASSPDGSGDAFSHGAHFILRWFTPTTEVPLCGHATLAAAAVLLKERSNASELLHFHTLHSGILVVTPRLEMSLPFADPVDEPLPGCSDPDGPLVRACTGGLKTEDIKYAGPSAGGLNYLVVVLAHGTTRKQLEAIRPDFAAMQAAAARDAGVHGVIVAADGGDSGYDVISRFFGPWMGIPEDHVTGSAHAVLGPLWARRTRKTELRACQCSARGGELELRVLAAPPRCVVVSGAATVVIRGTMRVR